MTVSIEQAQLKLAEFIRGASPGDAIVIEDGGKKVAKLVVEGERKRRKAGFLKGKIHFIGPDDDSHLEDFKEYME